VYFGCLFVVCVCIPDARGLVKKRRGCVAADCVTCVERTGCSMAGRLFCRWKAVGIEDRRKVLNIHTRRSTEDAKITAQM